MSSGYSPLIVQRAAKQVIDAKGVIDVLKRHKAVLGDLFLALYVIRGVKAVTKVYEGTRALWDALEAMRLVPGLSRFADSAIRDLALVGLDTRVAKE